MVPTNGTVHTRNPKLRILIAVTVVVAALLLPIAAFASQGNAYELRVSDSSNRQSDFALSGSTLHGDVYVFLTPTQNIEQASFWVDNTAATGTPTHVESYAPFDFLGTASTGGARPWDTNALADGAHSMTVKLVSSSATTTVDAHFTVANHAGASPSPRVSSTPAGKPVPTPPPTAVPSISPAPTHIPAGFVGASGSHLTLGGRPFTFTGFNLYQANSRSNCSYTMGKGNALDTALSDIGAGTEVIRAWFFQALATTKGKRDWSAFDHTLAVAKAHGVKVIVTLGNQWGSCESGGYKTDSWYKTGYKTTVGSRESVPYRQYVQEIVTRYANDPTIAMWQLMNEAEIKTGKSASSCAPVQDLYNFAADVSGLIKSIDRNHLVNLGTMGGSQCGSQGGDYQKLGSISTIDVLEFHDYGHDSTAMPTNLASDITASKALGKPIFVGEAGIQVASGGSLTTRASEFTAKCKAAYQAGVGGWLVWSWNNNPSNPVSWEVGPGDPTLKVVNSY